MTFLPSCSSNVFRLLKKDFKVPEDWGRQLVLVLAIVIRESVGDWYPAEIALSTPKDDDDEWDIVENGSK